VPPTHTHALHSRRREIGLVIHRHMRPLYTCVDLWSVSSAMHLQRMYLWSEGERARERERERERVYKGQESVQHGTKHEHADQAHTRHLNPDLNHDTKQRGQHRRDLHLILLKDKPQPSKPRGSCSTRAHACDLKPKSKPSYLTLNLNLPKPSR